MKNPKEAQCAISINLDIQERDQLVAIAREIDLPRNRIIRQLIRYFLQGRIEWLELFEKTYDIGIGAIKEKVAVRTCLPPELYTAFVQFVEKKGSTTGVVLRRLIFLYITHEAIWKTIWLIDD